MALPLVLIVEDTPLLARVYAQMLEAAGYRVQTASNILIAVALAGINQPVAILMDWDLGKTDGGRVIRELKGSEGTRDIPVVVITAWNTEDVRRSARAVGAAGFLAKPCSLQALGDELARVTGVRPAREVREEANRTP